MPEQVSFNINELTQGTVDGTGVFDVLMKAVKAHLKGEFEAGRIRGTDYSNAYVMSVAQVLSESSQYATQRAKLEAELKLLDAQTLQVKQETQTSAAQAGLLLAQTSHVTKQELQTVQETKNLVSQELQTKAQTTGIESQTAISDYELANTLPKNIELLDSQLARTAAESMNLIKQGAIYDSQLCKTEAEIARINIETTYRIPEEVNSIRKQTMLTQVQTDQAKAQTQGISVDNNMKEFQMAFVLPKELEIKESQLSISMKEVLLKEKQIELSSYELLHKLPADVALTVAQDNLYTQKAVTEKAQVDNTIVGEGSVIALSNNLLEEQANAYVVNANQTAAKLMIDTWVVRHTADPEGNLETDEGLRLTNADIGLAVAKIL